ncbi:hypothetical protein AVEN_142862-1 [Araneus ventricosus]|uniref:Uncharacterized protein n=1 Tax=Araneus ventricosus TaxID=182803 RepID=A0A4Y2VP19_ARAVE|nr:hypothetical protein AVEN_142862-1 [Araneus ventricosus]
MKSISSLDHFRMEKQEIYVAVDNTEPRNPQQADPFAWKPETNAGDNSEQTSISSWNPFRMENGAYVLLTAVGKGNP